MIFTIHDLGFSFAGLLLEGWFAFAARCVCALAAFSFVFPVPARAKRAFQSLLSGAAAPGGKL